MKAETARRYILTACAFIFVTCLLGGWLQANVQEWAKASGQDQYLVRYVGPTMSRLVEITETPLFLAIAWSVIGGSLILWIDYALRKRTRIMGIVLLLIGLGIAGLAGWIILNPSPEKANAAAGDSADRRTAAHPPIVADQNEYPIAWNKEPVLSLNLADANLLRVDEIGWTGVCTAKTEIHLEDAYVISAITGTKLPLMVSTQEGMIAAADTNPIPPKASITMYNQARILEPDFFNDWAQFDFVVRIDGKEIRKTVTRDQIVAMFGERRALLNRRDGGGGTEPRVTRKGKTSAPDAK
jgi:hypothetical protein